MAVDEIQYSTSKQFVSDSSDNNVVGLLDKRRIAAYDLYDGMFHNRQESLKLELRGENALPIYLPSSRKIIEATSRYLMVNFDYYTKGSGDGSGEDSPEDGIVNADTAQGATTVETYFADFFKREKIKSKFVNQKRYSLIRGDAMWYITADPNKKQGTRLSLHELDPRQYFPIDDPDDNTRVIGCHIVDLVQDPNKPDDKDAKVARRQTYRKEINPDGTTKGISSERTCWEIGKWDDRIQDESELVRVPNPDQDIASFFLPSQITQLPVYHLKNNQIPNSGFGLSELAGMETLIFACNQSITDEDLTMIMQGLGMYKTNAAPPQNVDGSVGDWNVGPGQVIEVGVDQYFDRVTGVSDVSPYQDHLKFLDDSLQQGSGTPEIAVGAVDVAVAESGIALMLQMGPILAKNAEKELEWILVTDQMFHDLVEMWLPAYEQIQPNGAIVQTIVDDPMPVNRDAKLQELILLYTSGAITLSMVVTGLMALGYEFPDNDPEIAAQIITEEQNARNAAAFGDPYAGGDAGIGGEEDSGGDLASNSAGNPALNGRISAGVT